MTNVKSPIISIVTVVYNGVKVLRPTIESIVPQLTDDVEHIIIDGSSTDGTLDIIKEYEHYLAHWVSEPDGGIYNAMNKGIRFARGEYIHFLNAGDTYVDLNAISGLVNIIKKTKPDFISSTVNYILPNDVIRPLTMSGDVDTICHPGLVVKADLYRKNLFDENFRYASDIEFFLRVIERDNVYLYENPLVTMPSGGVGASSSCLKETILIYLRYRKFLRASYSASKLAKLYLKQIFGK